MFFIPFLRLSEYRLLIGHHNERRVRQVLDNTFQHLTALSELSTLTRDELEGVSYHHYRFMGKFFTSIVVLILVMFVPTFLRVIFQGCHCHDCLRSPIQ